MRVRCPHCHNGIEIVGDDNLKDISCPSCGSNFNMLPETQSWSPTPKWLDHFQLLDNLGTGGFGTVWKALDTKLDRLVAVKIPRRSQVSPAEEEIFLREARAAAQLRHPSIVAVHEVGRQESGDIYIVSDFVKGVTLADHLTVSPFTPREAAQLCAQIGEALHHAHESGVIHRDLKPSNIMLDAEAVPHLMDFGLAKREAGEITMTVEGKLLGTPAYMSPEQARGEGHRVDRRADVYSLGVVLFELLTGELPFRGNQRMLLHQVINDDPPSPRKFNSRVPRDLETICLRCLEKDRIKRYASAAAMADDLRRYLDGKAIQARPVGFVERSWRWCRRNSVVSALTAAVAASLLVGSILSSWFWLQARAEAKRANTEAKSAKTEATRANTNEQRAQFAAQQARDEADNAQKSFDILLTTFGAPDALGMNGVTFRRDDDRGRNLDVGQILLFAVERARIVNKDKPLLLAKVLDTVGNVHRSWAEYPTAKSLLDEALALRRLAKAPDLDMAESLHNVGRCYHDLGHYDKARECYESSLEIRCRHLEPNDPLVATTKFNIAWLLVETKDPEAEPRLKEVIESERRRGDQTRALALGRLALVALLNTEQRYPEAIIVGGEALAEIRPEDELLQDLANGLLAWALHFVNPLAPATRTDEFAPLVKKHLGARHPYYALMLYQSSRQLAVAGKNDEASKRLQECLAIVRETVGLGHPMAILPVQRQADNLARHGDFAEGVKLFDELREKRRELFGDRHPLFAEALFRSAYYTADHGGAERVMDGQHWLAEANRILDDSLNRESKFPHRMFFVRDSENKAWYKTARVALSPNGRYYVAVGEDTFSRLHRADTGELIQEFGPHSVGTLRAAFSPDGTQVLIAERDGSCRLWSVDSGQMTTQLESRPNTEFVGCLAFSSDGLRVLACALDGTVSIWDAQGGTKIRDCLGPAGACTATFLPDGQRVVSAHDNGELRLWALSPNVEGRIVRRHDRPVVGCFVRSDSRTGCYYDNRGALGVWNLDTDQEIPSHGGKIDIAGSQEVAVSSEGRRLVALNIRNRTVDLWDTNTGQRLNRYHIELFRRPSGAPRSVSISSDGRFAACAVDHGMVYIFRLPE